MYKRRKKKRSILLVTCVALALGALSYGYFMNDETPRKISEIKNPSGEDANIDNTQEVNTEDPDLSNRVKEGAVLIFNTYYVKTGEILTKEEDIPRDAVGMTISEFKTYIGTKHTDYTVRSISSDYAKLFRQVNGYTPNYHVIKSDEDKIFIYVVNEDGENEFLDDTGLTTANLGESDKEKLEEGIVVETIEEVYNIIEDFSS